MSYDEADVRWNTTFVLVFATATLLSLAAIPLISFKAWVLIAGGLFGLMETIGLRRHRDRLPPLTYITRRYVPRWLTVTVIGAFTGLAAWSWDVGEHPILMVPLFALYSWLQDHFDVTYS